MLLRRCDRRFPLEESSLVSTVWRRGVCSVVGDSARSDTRIGVPVEARNFFEGLFLGSYTLPSAASNAERSSTSSFVGRPRFFRRSPLISRPTVLTIVKDSPFVDAGLGESVEGESRGCIARGAGCGCRCECSAYDRCWENAGGKDAETGGADSGKDCG